MSDCHYCNILKKVIRNFKASYYNNILNNEYIENFREHPKKGSG